MRTFDFYDQLKHGHHGEDQFSKTYPNFIRTDGRTSDLVCPATGKTVEVKYETRSSTATANFFVERWSVLDDWDEADSKPGGPWQSKADYFVYWFSDGEHFVFETAAFRERAESLIKSLMLVPARIQNKGYVTTGYPLPRKMFEDLMQQPRRVEVVTFAMKN